MHQTGYVSKRWLDTEAAADLLGLSRFMLEKLRLVGGGPKFAKFGRAVRYSESDLQEWAEQQVRTSTSDTWRAA